MTNRDDGLAQRTDSVALHSRLLFHRGAIYFHVSPVYQAKHQSLFVEFLRPQCHFLLYLDSLWAYGERHPHYCPKWS